jgi:hypothetical protein
LENTAAADPGEGTSGGAVVVCDEAVAVRAAREAIAS